jgi:hypothetical protein
MMFCRLGILNALLTWDISNLQWTYWDPTPLLSQEATIVQIVFIYVHLTSCSILTQW